MQTFVIIVIAAGALLFAIGSTWLAAKEHKKRKAAEKEVKEIKAHEEKAAEIINEANKTKSDAISGDIDNDLNYMAGKLRDYSKK